MLVHNRSMEDWNDYLLILALHRAKTLRGAAMMLATTHTTVSRRLQILHKRRGATVFEKQANGYKPTTLGQQLIVIAQQIEQVVVSSDRIDRKHGDDLSGPITLSLSEAMSQYLLLDDLAEFSKLYPNIHLTIDSSSKIVNLDKAEADIVIRGAKFLPDHLVGRRLFPYALSYYAQRDYFHNIPKNKWRWIVPADLGDWPDWLAESPYPEVPVGLAISDIVTRFHALMAGVGISRAACFMADEQEDLIRLPGAKLFPQVDIWVLTHPDLRHLPRIKLLMQYLSDKLEAKRDLIEGNSKTLPI